MLRDAQAMQHQAGRQPKAPEGAQRHGEGSVGRAVPEASRRLRGSDGGLQFLLGVRYK